MQKYVDSHCHLPAHEPFDTVFARANTQGIVGCVLNSVTMSDWGQIIQIAKDNPNVIGAVGIHPWHAENIPENGVTSMRTILRDNPKIVVGEIGLDKTRGNWDAQQKIFIQQLKIAIEYERTINLHCVHAWDEVLHILKLYRGTLPKIIAHSFDGTQNAINFEGDLYFSYSPNIANQNYKKVRESLARVPKNKILVESDSDDLTKTVIAANGVIATRNDVNIDDIFNNAMGVFFNG